MTRLFVAILLLLPVISFASEKPVCVDAEGEAYMSEIDTPKEVMERARRDAQNKAIEQTAEERIKLIAARKKEDLIPLGFQEGLFRVYDAKSTGMISDLVKRLNQLEPTDWTEAAAVYVLSR